MKYQQQPYKYICMNFFHLIKKKFLVLFVVSLFASNAFAQSTNDAATANGELSGVAILFLVMTIVLAFVIWGLSQVLLAVSRQLVEKLRKSGGKATLIGVLLLLCNAAFAQDATTAQAVETAVNYGGMSAFTFYMFVGVMVAEVIVIFVLSLSIFRINAELNPSKKPVVTYTGESAFQTWWTRLDKKVFTKAIPVEKEADILLDHNYDGIKELDNSLPPWWKYGFYITIFIGVIYLFNYHVFGSGKNPSEEYMAEIENAKVEMEIYESKNKDKIDENNVPMADATGLTIAQNIYSGKCVACHGPDGGGGAGPNLTDNYWLHKGSLNDIYKSIKVGYPDKGMQSWASVYTPKEISYLASYIKKMHGTKSQNPKAPQGDLYTEEVNALPTVDSTKKVPVDSLSKVLSKN